MHKFLFLPILSLLLAFTGKAQESKRIVSLAPSITQNLYLIEAQGQIVGCTRFCLTEAKDSIPVVADAVNVNMEKIVALRPDIVVTSGLTPPKVLDGFERMGIKTLRIEQPKNFNEICEQLITLGEISGKKELAETVVRECKSQLATIQKKVLSGQHPKIFMQIGANPLYTALPGTFMHDYIQQIGGINIAQQLDNASVSKEYVLLQNPEVIFIVGMGLAGEEEKVHWQAIKSLKAVKNNKVFPLDDYICSPTPVTFVRTVNELIQMIY